MEERNTETKVLSRLKKVIFNKINRKTEILRQKERGKRLKRE